VPVLVEVLGSDGVRHTNASNTPPPDRHPD
jgi:hypothetical protein